MLQNKHVEPTCGFIFRLQHEKAEVERTMSKNGEWQAERILTASEKRALRAPSLSAFFECFTLASVEFPKKRL